MRKRYYSKKDWWIWILFGALIIFFLIQIKRDLEIEPNIATFVYIIITAFLSCFLFGTYYELKEEYLLIRCGLIEDKLYYSDITRLNLKKSYSISMALSSDRIEIIYNERVYAHISPKHKNEFLDTLELKYLKLNT